MAATAATGIAIVAAVAACSSNSSSNAAKSPAATAHASKASHKPKATASAEPTKGAAAVSAVKTNWMTFFNGKTPQARRQALLQNGTSFAPVLTQQAKTPLAKSATAKVTKVTLLSKTTARVNYSVLSSGKTVLPNQTGQAVYQDKTWKVGDASFCGLLAMENGGSTATLPAQCRSVTTSPSP